MSKFLLEINFIMYKPFCFFFKLFQVFLRISTRLTSDWISARFFDKYKKKSKSLSNSLFDSHLEQKGFDNSSSKCILEIIPNNLIIIRLCRTPTTS